MRLTQRRLISQLERIYPLPRQVWPLLAESVTLGSNRRNTIVLQDTYVSRYHARLRPVDGTWLIEDLDSANGTQVNRERLSGRRQLQSDDRISLGKTWFRFLQEPVTGPPMPQHLGLLTAKEFEELIAELLAAEGFTNISVTGRAGDGGVDIAARCQRPFIQGCYIVQCKKYYYRRVSPKEVKEFRGSIADRQATKGAFVTTGSFSRGARKFAQDTGIAAIDGTEVVALLSQHRLWPF